MTIRGLTTSAPLDELRTRDNLSFLAQSSNSRHVADGLDVKMNATYQADRLDFANSCTTRYFDKNIPSFLEQNTMRSHEHLLNGEWSLQLNRRNNYLKDNLSVDALWNHATSAVSGTQTLQQQSDLPSFDITNDLQLVRRIDSHLLTISSHNRYAHRPHSLTADSILHDLTTDDFRSVTEARYGCSALLLKPAMAGYSVVGRSTPVAASTSICTVSKAVSVVSCCPTIL